jgi:hypothetical protein
VGANLRKLIRSGRVRPTCVKTGDERLLQPLESALNITALDQSFDHLDGPVLPTHSNKYRGVVASRPHFHERLVAD